MVSISDKFGRASDGTGYVHITTVKTARVAAALTLECYDLSKASTTTPVFFMTYKKVVDPVTGDVTISNQTSWKALVNIATNSFTNMEVAPGYTDVGNEVGDFVEFMPTSFWEDSLVDGLLVAHNQDGTHKTNMTLTTNAATLTSPKVITSINDTNNNELIAVTATASAVNEITVTNAATNTAPSISATGGDTNVNLTLSPKGTGYVILNYAGAPVQIVSANFSAVATGTTLIPEDDTIPQITEGTEFMTLAITPKSATNRLLITVKAFISQSIASNDVVGALFQDSTANALAAQDLTMPGASGMVNLVITHDMVAGTTSSTTFRFRAGPVLAATLTFNGFGGSRKFGGITLSNITITEYKV